MIVAEMEIRRGRNEIVLLVCIRSYGCQEMRLQEEEGCGAKEELSNEA